MDKLKKVTIYTDGACSGNPGAGGWAAILIFNGHKKELCGGESDTTNNRMEMLACVKALSELKYACECDLHSDSQYVVNAFMEGWLDNWIKNNWKTSNKEEVKNKDLWEKLIELTKKHKVNFIKVRGHADDELNNRCDELARNESKKYL